MKVVYLIVIISFGGGWGTSYRAHPMPDWETCFQAVKAAAVDFSNGAESEGGIAIFCAADPWSPLE